MEEFIEEEGKNVEEAIKKSLDKLGIPFEETYIKVCGDEKTDEEAGVRVGPKDDKYIIKGIVEVLLAKMGLDGEIWVKGEEGEYQAHIRTKGFNGLLIGKKGETLLALQHVIRRILQRRIPEAKLTLDVSNYRKRRDDRIVGLAKELAESAKETGASQSIDSVNPYERWLIHTVLEPDPDVVTHTEGEGVYKTVIITPKQK
jgi:spoIIIJ-associated protein